MSKSRLAHFTAHGEEGIAYNDNVIAYAALVEVELPEEVVYDSIWKYAPDKSYRFAVLEKNATLRYFQKRPRRMPNGFYIVNEEFQKRSIFNNYYFIDGAKLDLDPNYKLGILVER